MTTDGKRLATEQDVNDMCELVAKATCIEEIPEAPENVYFFPNQIEKITRTNNPFVIKINQLVVGLQKHSYDAIKLEGLTMPE